MIEFSLNGASVSADADPDMPLLWWLRDAVGLTGTKYGCGIGSCGACTVHVDDEPTRACLLSIGSLAGRRVTTIEGLSTDATHPVQQAWIALNVPQCGYCQAGQIMSAVALLQKNPDPDDDAIDAAMTGNICRCGTYTRIRAAVREAAARTRA